ncbi:HAD family phosphatase [Chroococcus sp. FPU101]|uniref:HAD family hydrolase n=1 Tax=Chroococcus sp. FPU101 TaxID=1974212 RepID=UPI001A8D9E9F|nr:HAD-IA family hydrolase [Chroococcus sp. FPU101]GFE69542.1 HAD-superfamily hydrolase, subfamily IA, variant 3 [Chroococcus sp. FPU101]
MLSALLFDLDGTLADTNPIHFLSWQKILQQYGLEIDQDFYEYHISGKHNPQIIRDIFPDMSTEAGIKLADEKESLFRELATNLMKPLPGLVDFLNWATTQNLQLALVTNAPKANVDFMLNALELSNTFPIIVLGEELPKAKPDPIPYQITLDKLGIKPENAIAFEDSPSGIISAVGANILTVGVLSTHPVEDLLKVGAKWVIEDFTDSKLKQII